MRSYVGGHQAVSVNDFLELALGTPVELWLGVEGETEEERAARLDAAGDILADHPEMPDNLIRIAARVIATHPELFDIVPLARPARRRTPRRGVAA
ncbi:hypothetical protein [Streptomyces mutabilis]|uniref:hypothetical protein n=1 Tax=Streptomyces mutabilis TaxID=67332 RepID=UPI0034DFB539